MSEYHTLLLDRICSAYDVDEATSVFNYGDTSFQMISRHEKMQTSGKITPPRYPAMLPASDSMPFECTNVWPLAKVHFEKAHGRDSRGMLQAAISDLPPSAPPYHNAWYEWQEAGTISGVFVTSSPWNEGPDAELRDEFFKLLVVNVTPVEKFVHEEVMAELRLKAKWLQILVPYAGMKHTNKDGEKIIVSGLALMAALDDQGRVLRYLPYINGKAVTPEEIHKHNERYDWILGDCLVAMFFQSMLSCHNVHQDGVEPPPKLSKKRVRHGGKPLVRYHTLKIKVPGTKRYLTDVEIRQVTDKKIPLGLHLVRGHFKTYSVERPLLRHAVGTFYWPPCLRGDIKAGVIGKTYVEESAMLSEEKGG